MGAHAELGQQAAEAAPMRTSDDSPDPVARTTKPSLPWTDWLDAIGSDPLPRRIAAACHQVGQRAWRIAFTIGGSGQLSLGVGTTMTV